MQYEDIVYRAGILEMAVRLERVLKRRLGVADDDRDATLGPLIGEYAGKEGLAPELTTSMFRINDARTDCAHPSAQKVGEQKFREIRGGCANLDGHIAGFRGHPDRPGSVMISCSLRYDMGNAGDIIKHGVLAEFAEWWCLDNGRDLLYADPFGGRPWGEAKSEAARRINVMHKKQRALARAQNAEQQLRDLQRIATYYGSSHVVLNASRGRATVYADDADNLAREDLKASGLPIISEDKNMFPSYKPGNGYAILGCAKKAGLQLVLLDPYREFMRDEFLTAAGEKRFSAIVKAAEKNPDLWIAVFVLDWQETGKKYQEFRKKRLAQRAIGIRCEPLKEGKLDGEDSYAMEMLLVSDSLKREDADNIRKLRSRIKEFANSISFRAPGGRITLVGFDKDKS